MLSVETQGVRETVGIVPSVEREYDRRYWGKVPPWKRSLWSRWIRDQRGDRPQKDVVAALSGRGRPLETSTYSELETGAGDPPGHWKATFRGLYGMEDDFEPPPDQWSPPPEPAAVASPDISDLIERLDRQAEVIDRLAAAVEVLAQGQERTVKAFLEGLVELQRAPADDHASRTRAGTPR